MFFVFLQLKSFKAFGSARRLRLRILDELKGSKFVQSSSGLIHSRVCTSARNTIQKFAAPDLQCPLHLRYLLHLGGGWSKSSQ